MGLYFQDQILIDDKSFNYLYGKISEYGSDYSEYHFSMETCF